MNRAQKIIEAYRNTPWRKQTQIFGMFAVFGFVAALVMFVYVWVTSMAGTYGLKVQEYQATARALEQTIEDKKARLAALEGTENLTERAVEAGYQMADPNRMRYLEVEGYYGPQPFQLAPHSPNQQQSQANQLPPEYTTSLIDWMREVIYQLSLKTGSAGSGGD
jgi:hypothetical protein